MYRIGFVILHYMTIEETKKCVKSIMDRLDNENYEIVIVDNASSNDSGKQLEKMYKAYKKIHIIINESNLGFSGGNNIAFEYAKKKLKCDFIVMTNNDTFLIQDNFFEKILEEYNESKFAVLGPKIVLRNNEVFDFYNKLKTIKYVKNSNIRIFIKLIANYLYLGKFFSKKSKSRVKDNKELNTKKYNVVLHGCCWIFSPQYISKFDGIEQKTFLYCEEDFLYLRLKRNNLLSVYDPEVQIYHEGNVATKKSQKNQRKSNIFKYKNMIKANKVLIEELKKGV